VHRSDGCRHRYRSDSRTGPDDGFAFQGTHVEQEIANHPDPLAACLHAILSSTTRPPRQGVFSPSSRACPSSRASIRRTGRRRTCGASSILSWPECASQLYLRSAVTRSCAPRLAQPRVATSLRTCATESANHRWFSQPHRHSCLPSIAWAGGWRAYRARRICW
jgi:hypothetical protein